MVQWFPFYCHTCDTHKMYDINMDPGGDLLYSIQWCNCSHSYLYIIIIQSQSSAASTPHKTNGTSQSGQGSTHSLQGSTHSAPPTFTTQSAGKATPTTRAEHSEEGDGSEYVSEGEATTEVCTLIPVMTGLHENDV